ncbi:hypothetical protein RJT34_30867 [Clitoria ternatea]|uniref:S-adenosyl-L-methionine-dependent methyltransferase n=1 Tax=Clitoria ternatea TaxID=43366 RepID=A0AAN9EXR1_CLITE
MTRKQASSTRRLSGVLHSKSNSSPLLSITLVLLGVFLLIIYACGGGSGIFGGKKDVVSRVEGDFSCTFEVLSAIPVLKNAYGGNMKNVLHIGPETCSVVSKFLREVETEAWGVEPCDIEDADRNCKALVQKGIVRVADIKFPLPYRAKSFTHVIVSDTLDYLSPKYLNKTLPELVRVSADGIIIFTGYPGQRKAKVAQLSKFGRPAKMRTSAWWKQFVTEISLEENEPAIKKFEQAASKASYKPTCQIFHLNSYH